ncbi:MAG TPA: hypothetical protein VK628_03885 [Flavitalea sp.]|nr:hypothetical protein [Flavitalea sp.]
MKKVLVALSLLIAVVAGSSFTTAPESVNRNVLTAFNNSYVSAKDVSWEVKKDFVKATFAMEGKVFYAYYKQTGEQIATTRNMITDELTASLRNELRTKYEKNFWLIQLFEVVSNQENAYYASLTNGEKTIVYKTDGLSSWKEFSRKKISE